MVGDVAGVAGYSAVESVLTPKERFDKKWKLEPETGCWLWTAGLDTKGYGGFRFRGRLRSAHRVAWELYRGPVPSGTHYGTTCVLHRCDVPACVNPDHLFLGSQADNVADRDRKGRSGSAKLSEADVTAIRRAVASGEQQCSVASRHRVSQSAVSLIVTQKTWRRVSDFLQETLK